MRSGKPRRRTKRGGRRTRDPAVGHADGDDDKAQDDGAEPCARGCVVLRGGERQGGWREDRAKVRTSSPSARTAMLRMPPARISWQKPSSVELTPSEGAVMNSGALAFE